jgi:hypothetical protein
MAKKRRQAAATPTGQQIEDFAEDLGRLLGTAQAKAEGWLSQRKQIVDTLVGIRDTTTRLLADLGHEAQMLVRKPRHEPHAMAMADDYVSTSPVKRKRRTLSAAARAAISAAQKRRWAKVRAGK